MALYFIFYSLFGMFLYGGISFSDFNIYNENSVFAKIDKYVFDTTPGFKRDENKCVPSSWFEKFVDFVRNAFYLTMDIIYLKLFSLTYLWVLFKATIDISLHITPVPTILFGTLNLTVPIMIVCLMLCIILYFVYQFREGDLKQIISNRLGIGAENTIDKRFNGFEHIDTVDSHQHDMAKEIIDQERIKAERNEPMISQKKQETGNE
jgi:hypothetical protein